MEPQGDKAYDLEERTYRFALNARRFIRKIPRSICNIEDGKQLVRASGSVGANFIEAMEAISEKDRAYRLKIARKEAKESRYWLRLVDVKEHSEVEKERQDLINEATQLMNIMAAIVRKIGNS